MGGRSFRYDSGTLSYRYLRFTIFRVTQKAARFHAAACYLALFFLRFPFIFKYSRPLKNVSSFPVFSAFLSAFISESRNVLILPFLLCVHMLCLRQALFDLDD